MSDQIYPPSASFVANAKINKSDYDSMYAKSVNNPEDFWSEHGKRIDWIKPFSKVKNVDFSHPNVSIKWFEDGQLNVSANCIDRHLDKRSEQTAIIWEGDNPDESKHISYAELHRQVCKLSNVYKKLGVKKRRQSCPLFTHGTRGSLCNAGMCKNWSSSLHCICRIFSRSFSISDSGLRSISARYS